MKLITFLLFFIYSGQILSVERSDAFIVRVYEDRFRVISPKKYDPKMNVIIENKTLVKITGRVETESKRVLEHVSIKSSDFKSVQLKVKKGEKVFFTPLAPAAQSVELIYNRKPYEIPPKK